VVRPTKRARYILLPEPSSIAGSPNSKAFRCSRAFNSEAVKSNFMGAASGQSPNLSLEVFPLDRNLLKRKGGYCSNFSRKDLNKLSYCELPKLPFRFSKLLTCP
jgi:hypothetical protein